MKDNKAVSITFRTTEDFKKALQKMADREKRTVSNMIEILLEAVVKTSKKK
jgi:predicted transcriptional regulator